MDGWTVGHHQYGSPSCHQPKPTIPCLMSKIQREESPGSILIKSLLFFITMQSSTTVFYLNLCIFYFYYFIYEHHVTLTEHIYLSPLSKYVTQSWTMNK